jgi:hypothetical protein
MHRTGFKPYTSWRECRVIKLFKTFFFHISANTFSTSFFFHISADGFVSSLLNMMKALVSTCLPVLSGRCRHQLPAAACRYRCSPAQQRYESVIGVSRNETGQFEARWLRKQLVSEFR